jgi:Terpene cyclase DEP1
VTQSEHESAQSISSSGRANLFLTLAIAGLLGQLVLLGAFLGEEGFNLEELADQMFSSTIAALTFVDLMMSAVVFLLWFPREAARVGIRRWWPYALATLGGLCFAFPLFLSARERSRVRSEAQPEPASAF